MSFLYLLSGIRNSVLDMLMLAITELGDDTAMILFVLITFWCIDKYYGYYLIGVSFLGVTANQALKLIFRIPRPWILDPNFQIVEAARSSAGGYSFPSGHSQSSVGVFGSLFVVMKNKWIRICCASFAILVPFSRMYLGVHTPKDVLAGALCAIVLIVLLKPTSQGKYLLPMFISIMISGIAFLIFTKCYSFPEDIDLENLEHGVKNSADLLGAAIAFMIVYLIDEKRLHIPVKAPILLQIVKVGVGMTLLLLLKSYLKAPLNTLFGENEISEIVRYFIVILFGGLIWPYTFQKIFKIEG